MDVQVQQRRDRNTDKAAEKEDNFRDITNDLITFEQAGGPVIAKLAQTVTMHKNEVFY